MIKKQLIFLVWVLTLFLTVNSAFSYGPRTHIHLLNELCAESSNSPMKDLCCNQEKDACMFGLLENDRFVFEYVTDFKKYAGTHNWNTVEKCFEMARNDREKAVCEGMALHNTMDSISHNVMVPDQVKKWGIVSEPLVHIFLESSVDDQYSSVVDEASAYLSKANIDEFCKAPNSILTRSTGMQSDWECDALAGAVSKGGMYQSVFLVGPMLNWGYAAFIKVSGMLPIQPWQPYHDKTMDLSRQTFQDIWPRQYDPTGFEKLDIANLGWKLVSSLIILALIVAIIWLLITKLFRRKR